MKELTHTIQAQTCPEAWVRAVEYLLDQPKNETYYLTVAIESPEKMTTDDFHVVDLVDEFLRTHDQAPVTTVAGTIFPANHYMREGATGVYESFPKTFPQIDLKSSWGTYSMRMLRKQGKEGTVINPLQILVTKLKNNMQHMRVAYEINVTEEEIFELPIYQAQEDRKKLQGQPCLSHLSFKLYPNNALTLAVMYRSHYYMSRALGNFLGLAQLQSFVAAETGLNIGPLVCYSTHARVDTKPKQWNLTDIKQLISTCRTALSILSSNKD